MIASIAYGFLKRGQEYTVLKDGKDWFLVKGRGKIIYVPRYVFAKAD